MAEIFISYARADRGRAETLAQALGQQGFSVWWDREIPPGRTFDEVIEEALADAKCVVVLWSRESVKSEWVKTEAAEAAKRRILVPILADEVTIPLEFRRVQSARLADWQRLTANPDWNQVTQALAGLVGRASSAAPPSAPPIAPPVRPLLRARRPLWTASGVVVVAGLAGVVFFTQMDSPQPGVTQAPEPSVEATPPAAQTAPDVAQTPAPADTKAASVETSPATVPAPPRAGSTSKPVTPPAERASSIATITAAPRPAPSIPLEDRSPAPEVSPETAERAGGESRRASAQLSFPVTYNYGVFRNQSGLLVVSAEGLRYSNSNGRVDFEASCKEIRRVTVPNMIADREQRTIELGLRDDKSFRFSAPQTADRNEIMSALSKVCGPF
ncbi:MAG TPA: TIR domain-containing protein [Gemmatimonadales bacterium]|nr:TIR domain-containing protein [Gemmatimonadales bacterium]